MALRVHKGRGNLPPVLGLHLLKIFLNHLPDETGSMYSSILSHFQMIDIPYRSFLHMQDAKPLY